MNEYQVGDRVEISSRSPPWHESIGRFNGSVGTIIEASRDWYTIEWENPQIPRSSFYNRWTWREIQYHLIRLPARKNDWDDEIELL